MSDPISDGELEMWRSGPSVYAPAVATLWHQRVLRLMAERDGFIARLGTADKERDLWRSEWQQITNTAAVIQRERDRFREALELVVNHSVMSGHAAQSMVAAARAALSTDTGALRGTGEGEK